MLSQVACPACGVGNRLDGRRELSNAKCGACGASLSLTEPLDVDDISLARHLKMTKGPVFVDIWAEWCGPCEMMAPNFKAAAKDLAGKARLLKLNADDSEAVSRLGVRGIPALIMFDGGSEAARHAGLMSRESFVAWALEQIRPSAAAS